MFRLPTGFDWADGVSNLPPQPLGTQGASGPLGTPNAADSRHVDSPNGGTEVTQEEAEDSPEIERAEQGTFSHRLTMFYDTAVNYLAGLGRGTFVQDSGRILGVQTVWRILSSRVKRKKGNVAELSYTAESTSFDSPPDEYSLTPSDLGLDILKHPRYSWALNPIPNDSTINKTTVGNTDIFFTDIKSAIIRLIQSYRDAPFFPSPNQINGLIQTNIMSQLKNGVLDVHYNNTAYNPNPGPNGPPIVDPVRWDGLTADKPTVNCPYFIIGVPVNLADPTDAIAIALAAAKELISKLWRQEDVPYIPVVQIQWSQFVFAPIYEDLGGYTQDPLTVIPDYFIDPNQNGTDNIFSQLSKINPQLFSSTGLNGGPVHISWLRKADQVDYQRTWFKVTRTWIGSPIGTWDESLYTTENRPQTANDFSSLI